MPSRYPNVASAGQRLKFLRETRGWSKREVARRAKMHHTTISRIETGAMDVLYETLVKIVGVFDMDMTTFQAIPLDGQRPSVSAMAMPAPHGEGSLSSACAPAYTSFLYDAGQLPTIRSRRGRARSPVVLDGVVCGQGLCAV